METASMISRIFFGEAMRATPPSARICAGTRSSAITAAAPASSAMRACSALITSMITPPLSISARPTLVLFVDLFIVFSSNLEPRTSNLEIISLERRSNDAQRDTVLLRGLRRAHAAQRFDRLSQALRTLRQPLRILVAEGEPHARLLEAFHA